VFSCAHHFSPIKKFFYGKERFYEPDFPEALVNSN